MLLIYVLIACAVITALLQHWIDTAVIDAVVMVNAVVGSVQEGRTEKAMNAIRQMLAPAATVVRAGERMTIPGEAVVPGDVVLIEAGDKVPADLRFALSARGVSARGDPDGRIGDSRQAVRERAIERCAG